MTIADIAAKENYAYMTNSKDYHKLCAAFAKGYYKGARDKAECMKEEIVSMLLERFGGVIDISKEINHIKSL